MNYDTLGALEFIRKKRKIVCPNYGFLEQLLTYENHSMKLKKQTETLLADMGLNMTTAVNIFLRQVLRTGGIPFEITTRTDDFYNVVNQKRLQNLMYHNTYHE